MARDEKIVIRLTEEIKQEFQNTAEELGMTISALGSYIIGDYLRRLKNEKAFQEQMIVPAIETMSKLAEGRLDNQKMTQIFSLLASKVGMGEESSGEVK